MEINQLKNLLDEFGDNVSFGDNNITNVGDIALDSISADGTDINVAVSDNSATAFTIKQGSDNYFVVSYCIFFCNSITVPV